MLSIILMEILLGEALWLKDKHVSSVYYIVRHRIYSLLFSPHKRIINSSSTYYSPHTPFIADKYLGYSYTPGEYEVTISIPAGKEHSFKLTIDTNGNRITSVNPLFFAGKSEIWIFGDSFVFGWGNNNETSFPFFLQQMLTDYKVVNYAVAGYGNLHEYLQLKREVNNISTSKRYPKFIVVCYGDHLLDRNVPNPSRLRAFRYNEASWKNMNPSEFFHPRALVDTNDRLSVDYVPLFCTSDTKACKGSDPSQDAQRKVTKKIVGEMFKIGQSIGSKMILAFMLGEDNDEVVSFASNIGYVVADIRPNQKKNEWDSFNDFDDHPGPLAQDHYAIKLAEVIKNHSTVDSGLSRVSNKR